MVKLAGAVCLMLLGLSCTTSLGVENQGGGGSVEASGAGSGGHDATSEGGQAGTAAVGQAGKGGGDDVDRHPVVWETPTAKLDAEDFRIEAGGEVFLAPSTVDTHSDAGDGERATLELTWYYGDQDFEMRLFLYFYTDGDTWYADEIRSYDGKAEPGWIFYTGRFFESPLGDPFRGDLDLESDDSEQGVDGRLHFSGLTLQVNF